MTKDGAITEVRADGFQRVLCDDGTVHFLRAGWDGLRDGAVGDRVRLWYEVRGSMGLWWAERLKPDAKVSR